MGKKACLAGALGLVLLLMVPLAWALDVAEKQVMIETKFSEVNLDNFERPLLGQFQSYFNLYSGITWHRDQTMFDFDTTDRNVFFGPPVVENRFFFSGEKKVRDNWHQWNTGWESGFGITDKITARAWGNFNFPSGSDPWVNRDTDETHFQFTGGSPTASSSFKADYFNENFHRWRKSESFGAEVNYRPFPNWDFYVTTNGNASWFREDIGYNFDDFPIRNKVQVRERNYNQELLAGFKYLYEMPAYCKTIAAMDLRRSPQPNVVDLNQWDRALLHMGEFMVNPYGGVRFVDRRRTYFQRFVGMAAEISDLDLYTNEIRNWPLFFTSNETARDAYAQGIIGANVAVGITDRLLLEGGYKAYLPADYKRKVTHKEPPLFGDVNFFDEHHRGMNEGWAGNAKLTYRFNPWFQVYTGYTGWFDQSRFIGNFMVSEGSNLDAVKTQFEQNSAEHRVFGGLTFLTPVKGEANPAPMAKRTLSDLQRPLLRPLQLGVNIYGGWRYVMDVFTTKLEERSINSGRKEEFPTKTDRSFAQGFVGGDIYFGVLKNLQFDTSAHYYAPARYTNRVDKGPFIDDPFDSNYSRFSGEETAWDVSPRVTYRPWPNFEAFLGANFGQVRTVRNQELKVKSSSSTGLDRFKETVEFTKTETIYNINAGVKVLF